MTRNFLDEKKRQRINSNGEYLSNIPDQQDHKNLEKLLEHFEHELPEQWMHLTLILLPFSNEK